MCVSGLGPEGSGVVSANKGTLRTLVLCVYVSEGRGILS